MEESGTAATWRMLLEAELREALAGSYSAEGIDRWFDRARAQLDGLTPRQVLSHANSPHEVESVRLLAESLRGGSRV